MDRGAWPPAVYRITELDMTEQLSIYTVQRDKRNKSEVTWRNYI